MVKERDFDEWKGNWPARLCWSPGPRRPRDDGEAPFQRLADADICEGWISTSSRRLTRRSGKSASSVIASGPNLDAFLAQEGAVALVQMSRTEGRLVHGEGYGYALAKRRSFRHRACGGRLSKTRTAAKRGEVRLEIDSRVHFEDRITMLQYIADFRARIRTRDTYGRCAFGQLGRRRRAADRRRQCGGEEEARILASIACGQTHIICLVGRRGRRIVGLRRLCRESSRSRPVPTDPGEAALPLIF